MSVGLELRQGLRLQVKKQDLGDPRKDRAAGWLWVTVAALGRCQTWAPLRGLLSFFFTPSPLSKGREPWGEPGRAWQGLPT